MVTPTNMPRKGSITLSPQANSRIDPSLTEGGLTDTIVSEVLNHREKLNQSIIESQAISKQKLNSAMIKIQDLQEFRLEIQSDLEPVIEQLDVIKNKFAARIYDKDMSPDGILSQQLEDYYKCLDLATAKLDKIFINDENKWNTNLKLTRDGLDRMNQQLSAFSAQQETRLAEILNPEKFIRLQ